MLSDEVSVGLLTGPFGASAAGADTLMPFAADMSESWKTGCSCCPWCELNAASVPAANDGCETAMLALCDSVGVNSDTAEMRAPNVSKAEVGLACC